MNEDLLFYDAYEDFYKMASNSSAFKDFCIEAYGADLSLDGFSDIDQINMILPYINDEYTKVLDIGCGDGKVLKYLNSKTGARIHGFDYSKNAIEYAKDYNEAADFKVGIIGEIDYPDESFDVIISMDSVYFAKDMTLFLSQVKRWLKPNGVFFVAYQEGDVMEKTDNSDTTMFAKSMKELDWEYEVCDITIDSYNMLKKKREIALKYKDRFDEEGNSMWGDLLISQTDYILSGEEEYLKQMARYIYICRK